MKLELTILPALFVFGAGCAARAPEPAAAPVATTVVTSAELGEKNAPMPKVGKAQRGLGDDDRAATKDGERRSYKVFGDWK